MAERKGDAPKGKIPESAAAPVVRGADESERALGRVVARFLPLLGLGGAIAVGVMGSVGSAILVVAATALLGTIALLWASLRTLSGDAPLAADLEALAAKRLGADELSERKRRVLRALKDLESEHAIGKIEDGDYHALVGRYREEAKNVMREMDLQIAPMRSEAEKLARSFLKKRGLAPLAADSLAVPAAEEPEIEAPLPAPVTSRTACPKCQTSNEPDAAFCKKCGSPLGATAQEGRDAEV